VNKVRLMRFMKRMCWKISITNAVIFCKFILMFYVDWFNSYVTNVSLKGKRYVIYFFFSRAYQYHNEKPYQHLFYNINTPQITFVIVISKHSFPIKTRLKYHQESFSQ
jgi:hypothetical protein